MSEETTSSSALDLATELTIAWLSNPNTQASIDDVPNFLERVHGAVRNLANGAVVAGEEPSDLPFTPAVSVRKSLASKDHIISLIGGKPYKTLRRHLAGHGLTPEQYRERYGLRADYPMVSESYSLARREMAKKIGLGRKAAQKAQAGAKRPRGRRAKQAQASEG